MPRGNDRSEAGPLRSAPAGERRGLPAAALCGTLALLLSACGGGGGSATVTPPPPARPAATIQGKVIDGYVSGATVWLDLNGNGRLDADEPRAQSQKAGQYQLELNETQRDCLPYTTLFVDVPVGAVDEESGPVQQAYQMALPPQWQPGTADRALHASPLTTVLWSEVLASLDPQTSTGLSCQKLQGSESLRKALRLQLDEALRRLVDRYNLSADRLYADYIQTADAASHARARDIVRGLQAGYAHRQQLLQQYPQASYVRAEVYQSQGGSPQDIVGHWYRTFTVREGQVLRTEKDEIGSDLRQVLRPVLRRTLETAPWGASGTYSRLRTGYLFNPAQTRFRCLFSESVSTTSQGAEHELLVDYTDAPPQDQVDACLQPLAGEFQRTPRWDYYVRYEADKVRYTSTLSFTADHPRAQALAAWTQLASQAGKQSMDNIVQQFANSGWRFEEPVKIGTSWWIKRAEDYRDLPVITNQFSDQNWSRTRYLADGTHVDECSADLGRTWAVCR